MVAIIPFSPIHSFWWVLAQLTAVQSTGQQLYLPLKMGRHASFSLSISSIDCRKIRAKTQAPSHSVSHSAPTFLSLMNSELVWANDSHRLNFALWWLLSSKTLVGDCSSVIVRRLKRTQAVTLRRGETHSEQELFTGVELLMSLKMEGKISLQLVKRGEEQWVFQNSLLSCEH